MHARFIYGNDAESNFSRRGDEQKYANPEQPRSLIAPIYVMADGAVVVRRKPIVISAYSDESDTA